MADSYDAVEIERQDGIATVSVDRPAAMNAVNTNVVTELASPMGALQDDDSVGAIVLTGTGDGAFIGGGALAAGLTVEEGLAALAFETADKAEGMAAFVERRDPEFEG